MTKAPPRATLAQLRQFVAVARSGSFSEAAAELGMSQSTLSEAVAALELALGQKLLARSPEGARLTPHGRDALSHAQRALQAVEDLSLSAQDARSVQGTLTVAVYRSLGVHVLPPILTRLRARHPDLAVRVLNAERDTAGGQRLLLSSGADIGLLSVPDDVPLLKYPLGEEEYLGVVPHARGAHPLTWDELRQSPVLLPPRTDTCYLKITRYLQEHGAQPLRVQEVDEDDVLFSMVAHGLGLAIQPSLAAYPLRPGLLTVPLPAPLTRRTYVAMLPQRAGLPHIRAFLDALGQEDRR